MDADEFVSTSCIIFPAPNVLKPLKPLGNHTRFCHMGMRPWTSVRSSVEQGGSPGRRISGHTWDDEKIMKLWRTGKIMENPNQAALLLYNTIQKHTNELNYSWEVSWNFWTASLSLVENRLFGRKQNDRFSPRGIKPSGCTIRLPSGWALKGTAILGCFCWTHHLWIHVHFYHWSTVSRCVNYYFPYYSTCGCSIHKIWIEHHGLASRRHCNDGFDMFRYMENDPQNGS